jgi:alpha-beta hydrolase superfamily lysophospholipase
LAQIPSLCARIKIPTLVVHGSADAICPIEGSRELLEKLGASDKTLRVFEGGFHELHNDLCKEEYFEFLLKWIQESLR